jgi:SNF2 family DNA or RNA helicase
VPVLDALMKLRQVCCDPRWSRCRPRAASGLRQVRALLSLCDHQVRDGRSLLIFSQFTSMLALIAEGLTAEGIRFGR